MKGPRFHVHYRRISVTLGSLIAGRNCTLLPPTSQSSMKKDLSAGVPCLYSWMRRSTAAPIVHDGLEMALSWASKWMREDLPTPLSPTTTTRTRSMDGDGQELLLGNMTKSNEWLGIKFTREKQREKKNVKRNGDK